MRKRALASVAVSAVIEGLDGKRQPTPHGGASVIHDAEGRPIYPFSHVEPDGTWVYREVALTPRPKRKRGGKAKKG